MKARTVKTLIISAMVCSLLWGLSGTAAARGSVDFNLSIGIPAHVYGPVYAPVYAPPPVAVYVPKPVYYPPRIYYSPAYYYPNVPWAIRHQHNWKRHEWQERHHRYGRYEYDD